MSFMSPSWQFLPRTLPLVWYLLAQIYGVEGSLIDMVFLSGARNLLLGTQPWQKGVPGLSTGPMPAHFSLSQWELDPHQSQPGLSQG